MLLLSGLLAAALTGCGAGASEPEEEETPALSEEASDGMEINDAASLAAVLQDAMESGNAIALQENGSITAGITTDLGSYPLTCTLDVMNCSLPSGEAEQNLSYNTELEGLSTSNIGEGSYVMLEDGKLVSYIENASWEKFEGDYLEQIHHVSGLFGSIADGSIAAEYAKGTDEFENEVHSLTFRLAGDALQDMLMQYGYWMTNNFSAVGWDSIEADVKVDATVYENMLPTINMELTSPSLAEALLLQAEGIDAAENANLSLNIYCDFREDYVIEPYEDFSGIELSGGELQEACNLESECEAALVTAKEALYAQNFEEITTTDPVTILMGGTSVTISFPWDITYYTEFHQSDPYAVMLRGDLGTISRTIFRKSASGPEKAYEEAKEYYTSHVEGDSENTNCTISDLYTLDTEIGQVQAIYYSSETKNVFGENVRSITYEAFLPIEGGNYLALEINDSHDVQRPRDISYDELARALFKCCSIGDAAPAAAAGAGDRLASIEEYLNVPENREECMTKVQSVAGDMELDLTADGDRMIVTMTAKDPGPGMVVDIEKASASVSMQLMACDDVFEEIADTIWRKVSVEDPKVVVRVMTFDGQEITTEEFDKAS